MKVQVVERPEVRQYYEKELQFFKVEDDLKVDPTYSVSGENSVYILNIIDR